MHDETSTVLEQNQHHWSERLIGIGYPHLYGLPRVESRTN